MPEEHEVTAPTGQPQVVTEPAQVSEEPGSSGSGSQESSKSEAELEARLRSQLEANFVQEREKLKAELEAERRTRQEREASIRGHQRETTQKLQELALYKRQLETQELTAAKLDRMERVVNKLAETSLDEATVRELNETIEKEKLRQENEKLKQQVTERQQPQQRQPISDLSPEQRKQLRDYYFPGSDVDPEHIDWQPSVNSREEWFRVVGGQVRKMEREQAEMSFADRIKQQTEEQLKQLREEHSKTIADQRQELEKLRSDAESQAKVAEEQTRRDKGMDREDNARPEGAVRRKSPLERMNEIPDNWREGTPEQQKKHQEALAALRREAMKGFKF